MYDATSETDLDRWADAPPAHAPSPSRGASAVARPLDEWAALAERVAAPPFLHPGWIMAWTRAFGVADLRLLTVRRAGELVAAIPMDDRGRALRAPANSHSALFGPVAVDDDARDALVRLLLEQPRARSIEIDLLDDGAADPIAATAAAEGMMVLSRTVARPPYIALSGTFADYERGLSRNRRRGLRRQLRRLEGEGAVAFEVHDGSRDLDRLLDELFAVEASGWKGERGTAIASSPETRLFYSSVAEWARDRGWLRLAFLRLDGRPIACDFALEHDGTWYTLKAGYDERLRSFGPGALLLRHEIELCYERGLERLDLLGHEDPFKASWTDDHAERVRLQGFRRCPRGVTAWTRALLQERARTLAARVRTSRHAAEAGLALQLAGVL